MRSEASAQPDKHILNRAAQNRPCWIMGFKNVSGFNNDVIVPGSSDGQMNPHGVSDTFP